MLSFVSIRVCVIIYANSCKLYVSFLLYTSMMDSRVYIMHMMMMTKVQQFFSSTDHNKLITIRQNCGNRGHTKSDSDYFSRAVSTIGIPIFPSRSMVLQASATLYRSFRLPGRKIGKADGNAQAIWVSSTGFNDSSMHLLVLVASCICQY